MRGHHATYKITAPPAEMNARLTGALAPLGYRVVSEGELSGQWKTAGLSPWALVLLLVPLIGWAVLLFMILASPGPQTITATYEQDGTVMRIDADDAKAEELFGNLERV